MSMHGSCRCKNIAVEWQTVDYSVVPRQCQCEYCKAKSADRGHFILKLAIHIAYCIVAIAVAIFLLSKARNGGTDALMAHNKCGLCAPFGRRTPKPLRGLRARSHKR